jgi:hypothetical protein
MHCEPVTVTKVTPLTFGPAGPARQAHQPLSFRKNNLQISSLNTDLPDYVSKQFRKTCEHLPQILTMTEQETINHLTATWRQRLLPPSVTGRSTSPAAGLSSVLQQVDPFFSRKKSHRWTKTPALLFLLIPPPPHLPLRKRKSRRGQP